LVYTNIKTQIIMKNYIIFLLVFIGTVSIFGQSRFDHSTWDQALLLNVLDNGKVNYEGFMKDSSLLYTYFQELSENSPNDSWSREEQMAYWINAYNAYTIKLVIDSYPIKSIKDLKNPWDEKFFKIDGEWFSLNDLEHRILRKFGDPRIHFAINCASNSCPVVWNRAYTGENLVASLDNQARRYINDPNNNLITKNTYKLSKIFSWFKKDFRKNGKTEISFINTYSHIKIINQTSAGSMDYDWGLNEVTTPIPSIVLD